MTKKKTTVSINEKPKKPTKLETKQLQIDKLRSDLYATQANVEYHRERSLNLIKERNDAENKLFREKDFSSNLIDHHSFVTLPACVAISVMAMHDIVTHCGGFWIFTNTVLICLSMFGLYKVGNVKR